MVYLSSRAPPADRKRSWPELEQQPTDDTTLRHEQIKLRVAEIETVVEMMRKLSQGEPLADCTLDAPSFDWERWKYVDATQPVMAGHSLGGSAAVSITSITQGLGASLTFVSTARRIFQRIRGIPRGGSLRPCSTTYVQSPRS